MNQSVGVVVVVALASCATESATVQCDDGRTCPEATVCDDVHQLCVTEDQVAQCAGQPDRVQCSIAGSLGACQQGVCLEAGCGNSRLDLDPAAVCDSSGCSEPYELCDDGNNLDGDGCSGNCLSDETCGNTRIDAVAGEQCDDGNLLDHDGCSSACRSELARWVRVGSPGPLAAARAVYDAGRDRVVVVGGRIPDGAEGAPTNAVSEWNGSWHRNIPTLIAPTTWDDADGDRLASFGLAYHHARRITVVAGGVTVGQLTRDVWGWDGATWTKLPSLPEPLAFHGMTYDARRERVVVFGGCIEFPCLGEDLSARTYEFDGDSWVDVSPASSPGARRDVALAYDPSRGVVVMFGGDGGQALGELWEYDGTTWTQRVSNEQGSDRQIWAPMMAFDEISNRMVIYGPSAQLSGINTMWLWDGTTMTKYAGALPLAAANSFTSDYRAAAVLIPDGTGRVMLYGGQVSKESISTPRAPLDNRLTWFFDGTQWIEPPPDPPAAVLPAMVVQPDVQSVLRFGGAPDLGSAPPEGETWELTRRGYATSTTANPPGLVGAGLAYDSARGQAVLFGGQNSSDVPVNRTWTRSAGTWSEHPATGAWPPARLLHSMTYDAARGEVLLFGGAAGSVELGDTWVWNGTTWTQRTPVHSPAPRAGAAMGYDPARGVVVLFSGIADGVSLTDTWIWDGTDWHDVTATVDNSPPPRSIGTLAWAPARQTLVLTQNFTFSVLVFDAWEWTTTSTSPPAGTWRALPASNPPAPHALGASYSTPDGSGITIAYGATGSTVTDEQWELRFDAAPGDSCRTPFDVDGDGLAGCDDPDCWRTCTPDCPPATSCLGTAETCGDGTCDPTENCRICTQDCPTCTDARCGDLVCDPGEDCLGDCP